MNSKKSVSLTTGINASETSSETSNESGRELAIAIARAAEDRKGADILILHVAGVSYLADYFVLVTGFSRAQVRAISNRVQEQAELECQRVPRHVEGISESTWILQDFGDVIVHIMLPNEREYYNLEAFWGHAERIPLLPSQEPLG
jgi:ribosome-associated protein